MKKVLALVVCLCMVLGCSFTAYAADTSISLAADNRGRGASDILVKENADGSIYSKSSNVSFYLPEPVAAGESITVNVTGSSDGDFRFWLIDVNETTNSDIYQMSANGFTSGDFDVTVTLTATAEATELFFKAPTWDSSINNLTIKSVTLKDEASAPAPAPKEDKTEEAATTSTSSASLPKTGVVSTAVVLGLGATAFGAGAKLLKKKEN